MGKKIDLRQVPRDETGRIIDAAGRDYVPSQYQNGNVTWHEVPEFRRDIRRDVYVFVLENPMCNRAAIAKGLHLKKTPWLIATIEDLVQRGYLSKTETPWRNGVPMFLYVVNV